MSKRPEDIAEHNGEDMLATEIDDFCDFDDDFDIYETFWPYDDFEDDEDACEDEDAVALDQLLVAQVAKILKTLECYGAVNDLAEVSDLLPTPYGDLSDEAKLAIHQSNTNKLIDLSRLLGREVEENELISSLVLELVEKELVSVIAENN